MPFHAKSGIITSSELTQRAIDASLMLARQMQAGVVGFVAGPRTPPLPMAEADGGEASEEGLAPAQARPVLARFRRAAQRAGVPFEGVFEQVARVDKAIIAAAEAQHCDLIVMVTQGRGAFGEFLFGSQTKAMLAGSSLPLLVLH